MKNKKRKSVRIRLVREFGFRPCHDGSYNASHPYPFCKERYALNYRKCRMIINGFNNGCTTERIAKYINRSRRCVSSYICSFYNVMTVWDARKIVNGTNKHWRTKERC